MADTADSPIKKSIFVSKAPPPPTILRGSFVPTPPKPTEGLDHLPTYYPAALTAKTNLIICKAMRKFPVQPEILELCKYVVKELTPVFRDALQNGALRQDAALIRMHELVDSLLRGNCKHDGPRWEINKKVQRSEEWFALIETIAASQSSGSSDGGMNPKHRQQMQALLDERGWSIKDLASQAGVDFHTADRFVKGLSSPYPSSLKKMADAFGVTIEALPRSKGRRTPVLKNT